MIMVLTIPALVALGHDFYLYYANPEKGFMFASLGFTWLHYSPTSYQEFFTKLSPDAAENVKFLLKQKNFFIGIFISVILPVMLAVQYLILRILFGGIGGTKYEKSAMPERSIRTSRNREAKTMQYKRK